MRKLSLIALLTGVVLLAVGPLIVVSARAQERERDNALQKDASQVAAAFHSYFERARSLDLLLAQNPAFRPPAGQQIDIGEANRALAYLTRLYPGAIGVACLIDDNGHELASVADGKAAVAAELSDDEAKSDFFKPTLALRPGQVYQAAPYLSEDAGTWVISNSTRIALANGRSLILHFEVTLESFRQYLPAGSSSQHVAVVDLSSHRVILQEDVDLPSAFGGSFTSVLEGERLPEIVRGSSTVAWGDRRYAVSEISRHAGNANHWAVFEWSPQRASFVPGWTGGASSLLGLALILLFLVILGRQHGALRMAARLDHLTGMANRKALEEALEHAIRAASHEGERVALLAMDLDGFKQINDTLGHERGDAVLQEIGRRLHANTFEYDTAARLGGDEFAVVLRHLHDDADVAQVAHRLREALVRPIDIDGVARFVGVSIGASMYGEHGHAAAELLRAADAAMYRAKRGREGVRVYDVGTEEGANASWLAAELLLAIENDGISLVYQPEYDLETGQIVGVEALARWHREDGPDIPPSTFVPLAEQSGLIRHLTQLTLRQALDEARTWRAAGAIVPVSVNLSAQVVTDRTLCEEVSAMLREHDLDGAALVLEITETALISDVDAACDVLRDLRAIGVRIELDDFGSGYASFKALQQMALDGVKVDRDLVNGMSDGARSLLAATVDMGRHLGLYVVAEGIEDEAGLAAVRRLGVGIAQGYHLARPMEADALRAVFLDAGLTTPA